MNVGEIQIEWDKSAFGLSDGVNLRAVGGALSDANEKVG